MSVAEQITEAQERVLTEMEAAQGRVIEMNQRIADAVNDLMPKTEAFSLPSMPAMDDMPKPAELIDRYFDFTAKMANANRSFYKEMVNVWAPAQEAETAAKPAKKAKKSA